MKFYEQKIKGVFLIKPEPIEDERGIFRRHYCYKEFSQHNISTDIYQSNISENYKAFTLRGFHYQIEPNWEGKTFSCLKGKIYDIVVDLRKDSSTYMDWISFEISEIDKNSIHLPPGCANAFMTLEDNTLIHYYCTKAYSPELEKGLRYNDPSFNFKWPREPILISEKDKNHPNFDPD